MAARAVGGAVVVAVVAVGVIVGVVVGAVAWASHDGDTLDQSRTVSVVASGALQVGPGAWWRATGNDPWDVFVCTVPTGATSPAFGGLALRLDLAPEEVADVLNRHVSAYFATISHGVYRPTFAAAGTVKIGIDDTPQACIDAALSDASQGARGVLVVGDAEQPANQPGGFATMGDECVLPPCLVEQSRRAVYVGASDFHPDWGRRPPMDLVEHELGHALGWPHSGYDERAEVPHESALDVMSNSAAPRATAPDRRDAPDTLAINRLAVGWLPVADVAMVTLPTSAAGTVVQLQPSTGPSGTRLAVVTLGAQTFLTIEWLPNTGFDDHLFSAGVAVHRVQGIGALRTQTPLVGEPPYAALLGVGDELDTNGLRIVVLDVGNVRVISS